jgi:hypothetical protein
MIKYNTICVDTDLDNLLSNYLRTNRDTETAFKNGIQNLSNFNTKDGYSFDSLTYLAVNYFYDQIFVYYDAENVRHSFRTIGNTTLSSVKGYLDACNYTPFTPINTIDTYDYKTLFNAPLFTECYLVIQTAYFFGSATFGNHKYIEVVEHYRKTSEVLKSDLDKTQLSRAFEKIDTFKNWNGKGKKPTPFSKDTYLNNWYYGVLDLIVNVFKSKGHDCKHFNYAYPIKEGKVSEFRIYNKLIQTPRILRKVQPFEMVEFDIKSGHLSYIDLYTGSNVSKTAYDNYASAHGISRDEAKRKFQAILNWRKYRTTKSKQKQYHATLCGFGYTTEQATKIISDITDAPDYHFGHFASKYEMQFTSEFVKVNKLKGTTRGHDAIYLLKERDFDYSQLITSFENGIIQFELKPTATHVANYEIQTRQYNTPDAIYFTGITNKRLLVKHIVGIVPDVILTFTDFVEVFWSKGTDKEQRFDIYTTINYHEKRFYFYAPKINTSNDIQKEMFNAYDTLLVLNNYLITPDLTHVFAQHIRKFINFDLVAYSRLFQQRTANEFAPILRDTQISTIYNENQTNDIDFNTMVAQNMAEGFCSAFLAFENLKTLILKWLINKHTFISKPRAKKYLYYDLLVKMWLIDNSKTATSYGEIDCINTTYRIQSISTHEMAVFIAKNKGIFKPKPIEIQIDKTRTKERKAKQLAFQTKKHQKSIDNYQHNKIIINEVSAEIIKIFNQKPKYDIRQK